MRTITVNECSDEQIINTYKKVKSEQRPRNYEKWLEILRVEATKRGIAELLEPKLET